MCHAMHTALIVTAAWAASAVAVGLLFGRAHATTQVGICPTCEHPWSKHWDQIGCFIDTCPGPKTPPGPRAPRRARRGRWI